MLKCGSRGEGSIKNGPQIWHECLDGTMMLLVEMRNIQEKECVYVLNWK